MNSDLLHNDTFSILIKVIPFILTILGLIIRYYFDKDRIKIHHLILIFFLSSAIVIYALYGKIFIGLTLLLTGILLAFIAKGYRALLIQLSTRIKDYYKTYLSYIKLPNESKVRDVLNKYSLEAYQHYYVDSNYDLNIQNWKKTHPNGNKRPIIFMKVKPRKSIPWYALIDYLLLRDLKYIGFRPCVLVYDIPYDIVNAGGDYVEIRALNELKIITKNYIKKIIGHGVEVVFSSEFFNRSERSKVFHDQLFPYIIDNFVGENVKLSSDKKTSYTDKNEAQLKILGFMSVVAVQFLSNISPTYVLQWEERKSKWKTFKDQVYLILNRTIEANGKHLNSNKCFKITSSNEETVGYITRTPNEILKDELPALFRFLAEDLPWNFSDRIMKLNFKELTQLFREWEEMNLISSSKYAELVHNEHVEFLNKYKASFEQDEELHLANYKYTLIKEIDTIQSRYNILT